MNNSDMLASIGKWLLTLVLDLPILACVFVMCLVFADALEIHELWLLVPATLYTSWRLDSDRKSL